MAARGEGGSAGGNRRRVGEVHETATRLFRERGYEATSVEEIAQALGLLKGSLYYYISSKEDLLFQIVSEVHEDVGALLEESLGRADLKALDRVALYIRNQALYNVRNVTKIAVYYREIDQLGVDRRDAIRSQRRAQHAALVAALGEGQVGGDLDSSVDIEVAAHCIFGAINWLYTWWRPNAGRSEEQAAESCVNFILGGITGDTGATTLLGASGA